MTPSTAPRISCTSLGMVIIDEIHMPNRAPPIDVLGGSASFVTLGQRLFKYNPAEVGCMILAGDDFPLSAQEQIEKWGVTLVKYTREGRKSTRGRLVYKDDTFGPKTFEYMGDPVRATPIDLLGTPLLHSNAVHFLGTPKEILQQVPALLRLRALEDIHNPPFIVWEPLPAACVAKNRASFLEACKLVNIFSPDHLEIAAIFEDTPVMGIDVYETESYGQTVLDSSIGPAGNGVVVIRVGDYGALSMSRTSRPTWLPSYYCNGSPKIIDPTGAGNAFLGGLIVGWQETGDLHEAMFYGQVAASFALEQIGLPVLEKLDDKELWNGVSVAGRLKEYRKQLGDAEVKSGHLL